MEETRNSPKRGPATVRVLALGVILVAAGCVTPPDGTTPPATGSVLPDLSDVPAPVIDTARARMWWESFVKNHPERHTGTPTNIQASEQIARDLEAAGYEAKTFYYTPSYGPLPPGSPSPLPTGIRTVVGVKEGSTMPDRVVAWVAHYDSNQGTIYAAYDDGSGTAVAIELARVLAAYNNSKTLMPIFFDAEEIGLVASNAFVKDAMAKKEVVFDMVIGHDMTGINCPGHEWPMYQFAGENFADVLVPIEEALYTRLSYDWGFGEEAKDCIVLLDLADRNSDERRFKEAGVPVLRMAGGRKATDYPAYHKPNDTIEYLYEFVGGPENYEKGLRTVIEASYWNAVVFDRLPPLS